MSVEARAISMYGKEFDSYKKALEFLYENNWITFDEAEDSLEYGEIICENIELDFEPYSHFSGGVGVLGKRITAEDAYCNPHFTCSIANKVEDVFGHADFFMFVQWY